MNVAAAGAADDKRRRRAPAIMGLGDHIDDLVKCAANEVHELKFGDGTHACERCSECGANDGGLSDGSINYAFRTEAVDETISDFKRPTVDANVLSQAENGRVSFHFFPDALADGFEIGELWHSNFNYVTSNALLLRCLLQTQTDFAR